MIRSRRVLVLVIGALQASLSSCIDSGGRSESSSAQSCMTCHNGSQENDYSGVGIENPHPFPGADEILCTTCHGGNPNGDGVLASHVPPPPEIGDEAHQLVDRTAYFNRLTLTGVDKLPDYVVGGRRYSALDWLQFVNPGDLRVVNDGRGCGRCHSQHGDSVATSLIATEAGIFSGADYAVGIRNSVPESDGLWEDTAADLAFRRVEDPSFQLATADIGDVSRVLEVPVIARHDSRGPDQLHGNEAYSAADLVNDLNPDNSVVTGSRLSNLYHEQVAFTCGDCHLGSAGANNRYGDFRSSGCTACHMRYSLDGRSTSGDPNVPRFEPANPDRIDPPERAHVRRHLVSSIAKRLPSGEMVPGIDDYTCAGCHQGSNRTVMQFWGIRLDQNADVHNRVQYPANPITFANTNGDTRLFDPAVGNNTFNGRNRNQYLVFEDYDGDLRDDTPADVHYDAGMGCIDCHGSYDVHGGNVADGGRGIASRMEQAVAIECESCHGSATTYAPTVAGTTYAGASAQVAVDARGNQLRHVVRDGSGHYWLTSRLTGARHYVKQTRDTVVDSGRVHPQSGQAVYSARASYAMGRSDGSAATGIGPRQRNAAFDLNGFSHMDDMSCEACHSSWTNSCIGCHLGGEYNTNNNNFSNITGDRIVFRQANADFTYQTPVPFQIGVGPRNRIVPLSPNTEVFWQYRDLHGIRSRVFAFTDRNGGGNNAPFGEHPALSHNAMMPHSIRGKVDRLNEGPRYCAACHLTDSGLTAWRPQYETLRTAMRSSTFTGLDVPFFQLLQRHIGQNTGNELNSPLWVHMVAGLGSGLFLFDENGCPVNPLDVNAQRRGCFQAPASNFDLGRVVFNLDRLVDENGVSNASSNHMLLESGALLRDGSADPNLAGPLGRGMILRLTDPDTGIVLDSWLDTAAAPQGNASSWVADP